MAMDIQLEEMKEAAEAESHETVEDSNKNKIFKTRNIFNESKLIKDRYSD